MEHRVDNGVKSSTGMIVLTQETYYDTYACILFNYCFKLSVSL